LLERFAGRREEEAFAELVRRHGPMVLGVCRRVLHDHQEAEDALQATFFILARKAGTIRRHESLASWLYGVAYHVALRARARASRRADLAARAGEKQPADPLAEVSGRELLTLLDEELQRLPAAYRAPLVLCCLEGRTHVEAARQLGWTKGIVRGRVERGRELLRARLARRGLALSAAALATVLMASGATAALPAGLAKSTLEAGVRFAAGGLVAARTAALAEAGLRAMAGTKVRVLTALVLALGLIVGGVGALAQQRASDSPSAPQAAEGPQPAAAPPAAVPRTDRYGDPLPEGVLARLGTVRFRHGFPVNCLSFSPDGKTLAAGDTGNTLRVWDVATGKKLFQPGEKEGSGYAVAFSPDGKMLAAGGRDDTIALWDPANWKVKLREFKVPGEAFFSVAFSPDGKTLAGGTLLGFNKGIIHLWDVPTGKETGRLEGHQNCVTCLAFSPDGKTLASACDDKTVRLWEVATAKELHQIKAHPWRIWSVIFSPDGKAVVTAGQGVDTAEPMRVWDVATGREVRRIESPERYGFRYLAFSPDGKSLVSSGAYSPRLWDWATGKQLRQYGTREGSRAWGGPVAFTADGKTLAVAAEASIGLWAVDGDKALRPENGHWAGVDAVAFLPDGRTLVSSGFDGTIRLWNGSTDKELRRVGGPPWLVVSFSLSPDGKTLVTAESNYPDAAIRLWDVSTGKEVREAIKPPGMVRFVAFSPDGRSLVSGDDQEIWVWDAASGKEVRRFGEGQGRFMSYVLSPDGKLLARGSADDPIIRLWDVATGQERRRLEGHQPPPVGPGRVYALAFSADGKTLASGGSDATARLWDVDTGKELARFEGHTGLVLSVALSPNGRMLATAGLDRTLRLWEVATHQERRRLEGHQGMVQSLVFSADGRTLASGASDTTVLLWDVTGATGKGQPAKLSAEQLKALWADLDNQDAQRAYAAIGQLVAAPAQAVPLLQSHLRPVPAPDPKQLARLVADLGSDEFDKRDKAAKELERLGDAVEPHLRRVLAEKPAAEVRRVIDLLLTGLEGSAERVRAARALEALEYAGTPEARKLLGELARGAPDTWLTREAKATLERLGQRASRG
jgi:RNA polymerase sigma factor (sigma-70 family)